MNKKISLIMASAIATILTTYISTLTISNQALAIGGKPAYAATLGQTLAGQAQSGLGDCLNNNPPCQANVKVLGQELTQGIKAQTGKVLEECCKLLTHPFDTRPR
jgi:hypothetical protein